VKIRGGTATRTPVSAARISHHEAIDHIMGVVKRMRPAEHREQPIVISPRVGTADDHAGDAEDGLTSGPAPIVKK